MKTKPRVYAYSASSSAVNCIVIHFRCFCSQMKSISKTALLNVFFQFPSRGPEWNVHVHAPDFEYHNGFNYFFFAFFTCNLKKSRSNGNTHEEKNKNEKLLQLITIAVFCITFIFFLFSVCGKWAIMGRSQIFERCN
jgi:hypothetical protein